jgi:NADH-quinone oxidoreductase subunit G
VCTRCIRFCDEISGTSELAIVERGDRSVVDVFPGIPIDNAMAGNTVDICPVGALISHDFKYEARVWNMDRKESVCGGCAKGCNIEVESLDGYVKRLMPRENLEVNDWWMCDHGRYGWRHLYSDQRLTTARNADRELNDTETTSELAELISSSKTLAILVDPFLTCEELHLINQLADSRPGSIVGGWLPPDGKEEKFPSGFTISKAKHPNRKGAEEILGAELFGQQAARLKDALNSGTISTVIAFCGGPSEEGPGPTWSAALAKASTRIVFSVMKGDWLTEACLVLPATAPLEKEGTWINQDGRLQRVRSCWKPGTEPFPSELVRLQDLQIASESRTRSLSASGIFRELAGNHDSFSGYSHSKISNHGSPLLNLPAGVGLDGGSQ